MGPSVRHSVRRTANALLAASCASLVALSGCLHTDTRMQSPDEAELQKKEKEIKTVGDVTEFGNMQMIPVSGVGLVVGLDGTGSKAVTDGYRSFLEDKLLKQGYDHVKEMLDSPDSSLVLVTAMVPQGAHKGDPVDVEIRLPPQSRTTSLKGGYLKKCKLYNGDTTKNVSPSYNGDRYLMGHALVEASGQVLVGFGEGKEAAKLKQGHVWGGGQCLTSRSFYLMLRENQQSAQMAQQIAERINDTLQGNYQVAVGKLAVAENDKLVVLRVPDQYKNNLPRYLRVVRFVPLSSRPEVLGTYSRHLSKQLLNPQNTVWAAIQLEALGAGSIEPLKKGLASEHALVRFCSAEALAYLGEASAGEELARLVEKQPALRAFSLTAMASLDAAVCHIKLRELLGNTSIDARYGAFRALRALDEREPSVAGELLNDSFWVHRVAPHAPPLVHVAHGRRPEVVLFGEEPTLSPPFSFISGEYTVTATKDDVRCTVTRLSVRRGSDRKQCPLELQAVLRTLAELGANYGDVADLLHQADRCHCLSCALAVDAVPQATSVYYLTKHGADDPDFQKGEDEIRNARGDFLATPTLFEGNGSRRPVITSASHHSRPADTDKPADGGN